MMIVEVPIVLLSDTPVRKHRGGSDRENVEHGVPFVAIVERIPVADA
jgi:hypothetical protein